MGGEAQRLACAKIAQMEQAPLISVDAIDRHFGKRIDAASTKPTHESTERIVTTHDRGFGPVFHTQVVEIAVPKDFKGWKRNGHEKEEVGSWKCEVSVALPLTTEN